MHIEEADKVGPVTNFLHSLFDNVTLCLNNKQIENTNSPYAYRAYIENLLNFNQQAKETHLQSCLFAKDVSVMLDKVSIVKKEKHFAITSLDVANNKLSGIELAAEVLKNDDNDGFSKDDQYLLEEKQGTLWTTSY